MPRRVIVGGCAALMLALLGAVPRGQSLKTTRQRGTRPRASAGTAAGGSATSKAVVDYSAEANAVVGKYCVTCHNQRMKTAGVMFDTEGITDVGQHAEVWEKVIRKVRGGSMPPMGSPRPDAVAMTTWVAGLEEALDSAAAAKPNPGRVPAIHRLNRTEYPNIIRDLLAVDVDGQALLPVEDAGYGFDNVADVLTVSPALMERYMLAAAKVSRLAMGTKLPRPTAVSYMNSPLLWQEDRVSDDLPFGSRGGIAVQHTFPVDGEYEFNIRIPKAADYSQYVKELAGTEPLEVRLDYERVKLIPPTAKKTGQYGEVEKAPAQPPLTFRLPVKAGPHLLGIDFVADLSHRLAIDARPPRPSIKSFFFQEYPVDPQVLGVQIVFDLKPHVMSKHLRAFADQQMMICAVHHSLCHQ